MPIINTFRRKFRLSTFFYFKNSMNNNDTINMLYIDISVLRVGLHFREISLLKEIVSCRLTISLNRCPTKIYFLVELNRCNLTLSFSSESKCSTSLHIPSKVISEPLIQGLPTDLHKMIPIKRNFFPPIPMTLTNFEMLKKLVSM